MEGWFVGKGGRTDGGGEFLVWVLGVDLVKGGLDGGGVRRVGGNADGLAAGLGDFGDDVGVARGRPGEEGDRVGLGEFEGDGAPGAGADAGDDGEEGFGCHWKGDGAVEGKQV